MINNMRRICLMVCLILFSFISCQNQAEPVQTQNPDTSQTPDANDKPAVQAGGGKTSGGTPAPVFDPASITKEEKDTAMTEISQLIQRLNGIIRAKNYNAWTSYLDPDYFIVISSPEYLDRISQADVLVKQKIVLRSAQDYFIHVVVPARTNDRVDDIEFISQNRVKAYTVNSRGERLRLYDLERNGHEWKIIN